MVRLCMKDLLPCLLRILNLSSVNKNKTVAANGKTDGSKLQLASNGSNWKKLKLPVKTYLEEILSVNK
jgi:hypothetical protein